MIRVVQFDADATTRRRRPFWRSANRPDVRYDRNNWADCSNGVPPRIRQPDTVGPPAGPDVEIFDTVGSPVPNGQEGEVCIRCETVMSGYEGMSRDGVFWGDWFRSGDIGVLQPDGYLRLTWRIKEMINRGGEEISPREIETCVLGLPDVSEAVAYPIAHPTLGEIVGLCVVPKQGVDVREVDTLRHLAGHLAAHKCPRTVEIRETMPRLSSGKNDRLAVSGKRVVSGVTTTPINPHHALISTLWSDMLSGPNPPHDGDDFFDVGGDSLQATTFLIELEQKLGMPVSLNLLYEAPRFGALVRT